MSGLKGGAPAVDGGSVSWRSRRVALMARMKERTASQTIRILTAV